MNKRLLLLINVLISFSVFSQITVEESHLVRVSDVFEDALDRSNSISHVGGGTNLQWNYGNLVVDSAYQFQFGAPGWYDGASNFPNANLALTFNASFWTGLNYFIDRSQSGLNLLGIYADASSNAFGNGTIISIEPYQRIIPLPATYNTTDQNSFVQDVTYAQSATSNDSIRSKEVADQNFIVDAWGELTTPLGTYPVVRLFEIRISEDTTWTYSSGTWSISSTGKDTIYRYSFYTNDANVRYSLLEYEYDLSAGQIVGDVRWLKSLPTTSIENISADFEKIEIYPVPTSENLTIKNGGAQVTFEIVDVTGKQVYKGVSPANQKTVVNTSDLRRGLYFVKFSDQTEYLGTKKMIKK